jgi:YafQ family addiction module toxin component
MRYEVFFTTTFEKQLKKIKKKDGLLFGRLKKKIQEIIEHPEHYKPLRNVLKGFRRTHIDSSVLVFSVQNNLITFHYVKHHDSAY